MGGILVLTIILGVLTAVFTVLWWMMGEAWVKRDRRARGRHATESDDARAGPSPRVIQSERRPIPDEDGRDH